MENKQVKVPLLKKQEMKEVYYHFGWDVIEEIDAESETVFTMQRDENHPLMKKVKKLEKQYNRTLKKIPMGSIVMLSLAAVLIIVGICLPFPIFRLAFVCTGSGFLMIGLFLLLSFVTIKTNLKMIHDRVFKVCDNMLLRNQPDLPIGTNVAPVNESTDDIKKNVKI